MYDGKDEGKCKGNGKYEGKSKDEGEGKYEVACWWRVGIHIILGLVSLLTKV